MVSGGLDGKVMLHFMDATLPSRVWRMQGDIVTAVALTTGGVLSAHRSGRVLLWTADSNTPQVLRDVHTNYVTCMSRKSETVYVLGGCEGDIFHLDFALGVITPASEMPMGMPARVVLNVGHGVVGYDDGFVDGVSLDQASPHTDRVTGLTSVFGYVVSTSWDGALKVWRCLE